MTTKPLLSVAALLATSLSAIAQPSQPSQSAPVVPAIQGGPLVALPAKPDIKPAKPLVSKPAKAVVAEAGAGAPAVASPWTFAFKVPEKHRPASVKATIAGGSVVAGLGGAAVAGVAGGAVGPSAGAGSAGKAEGGVGKKWDAEVAGGGQELRVKPLPVVGPGYGASAISSGQSAHKASEALPQKPTSLPASASAPASAAANASSAPSVAAPAPQGAPSTPSPTLSAASSVPRSEDLRVHIPKPIPWTVSVPPPVKAGGAGR